ncbi:MAG: SUMF1/EgtB/PvdO family nonheme iron enzyme, partial [Planctomycetota bacterium JB042]
LAGTYAYMSPEQAEMKRIAVDHRTDVFSLGAVLYRALTLELPFGGDTSREVLDRILTTDPRPPRRRNERVPRDLEVICLKALEKRPDDRYPSAGAFAEDLRRFLAHEAITARPPSVPERLWRWSRRHPVAASGALLLPAATALVVVLVGEVRDRERVSGWRERIEAALRHDDWNGREDVVADARRAAEEARGAGRGGGLEDVLGSFERRREEDVAARVAEIERLYRRGKGGEEIEGRFETLVTPLSLRAVLEGLDRAGRAATAYPDFPEIGALTRVDSELRIDAAPPSADRPPRERPVARALPLDPISGAFGPPVPLGPLPVRARLPPGGWRIVVEDPASDAFAEFDRDLGIEARRETIRVRLRPEADVTAGMVRLPAARLVLDQKLGCGPVHGEVDVPSFWIDEAEVSNREYLAFVEATDHAPPAFWVSAGYDGDWRALPGVAERGEEWLDLPATGMSLYDMRAYAEWAGKRLPGHYELEYAIRGVEMLTELPKGEPANIHGPSTGSVDGAVARYAQYVAHSMPVRASAYRQPPHGLFHVHGNVMERAWGKAAHVDRGNLLVLNNSFLVMGGAWDADVRNDRIFEHSTSGRDDAYAAPDYGFRCVIGGHSHD